MDLLLGTFAPGNCFLYSSLTTGFFEEITLDVKTLLMEKYHFATLDCSIASGSC